MKRALRPSGAVSVANLQALLDGRLGWDQAVRSSQFSVDTHHIESPAPGKPMGFLSHSEYPGVILLTAMPTRGAMIPTAAIAHRSGQWQASPQIVKAEWLLERRAVSIQPVDWIMTLGRLAHELRVRTDWQTLDMTPWDIAASWPHWETEEMSWTQRANDLAERLGMNPLSTNTLMVKCRRLGLVRK